MNGAVMMDVDTFPTSFAHNLSILEETDTDIEMGCALSCLRDQDTSSVSENSTILSKLEDMQVDAPFHVQQLPVEVIIIVLSCCDVKDLLSLSQCSRELNQLCSLNAVWKRLSKRTFGVEKGGFLKKSISSWKTYFAQKSIVTRPKIFQWDELTPTGDIPTKRYQHTASAVGSAIYFIGGQELPDKRFDEIYKYDPEHSTVQRIQPRGGTPPKYARHTAVTIEEDKILTFGGYDGIGEHFQLCMYDVGANQWSRPQARGDIPISRTNHSATTIGHNMYMFGGMYKEPGDRLVFLDDFYVLNTSTMVWTRLQPKGKAPEPRCGHRLMTFGDKLLLFGGGSGEHWDKKYNDVHVYDPATNTWLVPRIAGVAPVCTFTIAFSTGPFLFLFGGQSLLDNSLTNDLYMLDTIAWAWTRMDPVNTVPSSRDMGSGTVLHDGMYMFGGYCGTAIDNFFALKMADALLNPFVPSDRASMIATQ